MVTRREKEKRKRRYSDAKTVMNEHDEGFSPTSFKLPEGVELFKFKEEKVYKIDVIPYTVGEGNPRVDEGYDHYERTYWVHRGIGPNQESYACLAKTFGKKCPVCEHRQRLQKDPESDAQLIKDLKPKERQLWLVYDYDEPDKGVQVMESAFYKSFGELLYAKVKASDDEDGFESFFHLEDGMTLKVSVEEDTFNGRAFFKPTNIEMRPRKKPLPSSITDDVPCLDELPIELSYKELKEKLMAEPPEDDEDEDEVEDGSELEEEEEEDEEPKKSPKSSTKSSKKSGSPSKTSAAKKKKDIEEEEEEEELEDEEEESEEIEDEDDESEDVEDEEEEDEEIDFEKGQRVKGTYKKKPFKGSVKKVLNGLVHVKTDDDELRVCKPAELTKLVKAKKVEEEEDEDEGEDEDESPKRSSKTSKSLSKKASKKVEEEEDEDIPFDDEEEEEEEEEDED